MAVVADASPLILLARAEQLPLLYMLFDEVWIPPAVSREAFLDDRSRPGAEALRVALGGWLHEQAVSDQQGIAVLAARIDRGEAEAILLAHRAWTAAAYR